MTASRVAALLHGAVSLFAMALVGTLWMAAASIAALVGGTFISGLLQMFGTPMALVVLAAAALQLVAALAMARGWVWGRIVIAGYSVLLLLVFPIGTAVGGFTLWALFRPRPPEVFLPDAPR